MPMITINIPDQDMAGVTFVREQSNRFLPKIVENVEGEDGVMVKLLDNPNVVDSDEAYIQTRVLGMIKDWNRQAGTDVEALQEEKAALETKIAAAIEKRGERSAEVAEAAPAAARKRK